MSEFTPTSLDAIIMQLDMFSARISASIREHNWGKVIEARDDIDALAAGLDEEDNRGVTAAVNDDGNIEEGNGDAMVNEGGRDVC